jgi:CRP/FNR family nitrogen fixation transcriptional regulator
MANVHVRRFVAFRDPKRLSRIPNVLAVERNAVSSIKQAVPLRVVVASKASPHLVNQVKAAESTFDAPFQTSSRNRGGAVGGVWPEKRHLARAQRIYTAGSAGVAWCLLSGSVRLDRPGVDGEQGFATIAVKGDVIGVETLLFGQYTFSATALVPCVLAPWSVGMFWRCRRSADETLLRALAKAERRAAEVIALRCGQAADRVGRLVSMLAQTPAVCEPRVAGNVDGDLQVALPSRQDMAEITALTLETVSRMVSRLRESGVLAPLHSGNRPAGRVFALRPGAVGGG